MGSPLELVVQREKSIKRGTKPRIIEKNGLIRAISTLLHLSALQTLPSTVRTYEKNLEHPRG